MSLTPQQAEAAHAPGSVAVVAGAGTGKTHMLTSRYLHHLGSGLSPLEVVAVTFTERAAAELKARVRRAVQRQEAHNPRVTAELEAAQISTIHALAARICRDHAAAAGVPHDFSIFSDLEKPIWLQHQLRLALGTLPESAFSVAPYHQLLGILERLIAEPILAEAAFAHGPARWPELIAEARRSAAAQLTSDLLWQRACATLRVYAGSDDDPIEQARQHALAGLRELGADDVEAAFAHFGRISRRGGSGRRWPGGGLEEVKSALADVQTLTKASAKAGLVLLELGEADELLAQRLPLLEEAFHAVRRELAAAKRRLRLLDFADLEVHALRALEDPAVRAHYRQRWRAFLVDEFQDTSPAQAELLARLTQDATVTLVGDEKQAIYGFRGADADVFGSFRARLAGAGGRSVELSESFRTHRPLVDACNAVFKPLLGPSHQELRAFRSAAPHAGPHLSVEVIEADKGVLKAARTVHEAHQIAQTLQTFVASGLLVHDDSEGLRPVTWGDVAVLARSWSPLDTYSEVFSGLGIPVVHAGGSDLLGTREAQDGTALLQFLADTRDDLALAALLRSPFFAVDDPTLYAFAQGLGETESWWDALKATTLAPLQRAAEVLNGLVGARRKAAPTRLLQHADYETGYSAVLANLPGAARREADWEGFIDLVRQLERGLRDVFAVARRLRSLLRAGTDVPRPALEAQNAVSLMSVHRAKGLEWPVVVVADLDRSVPTGVPEVLVDRTLGVGFPLELEDGSTLEPAIFKILKQRAGEREKEEARRVLYVAFTRARDRILLSATEADKGALTLLAPGLEAAGVQCAAVPFDPAMSLYPDLPQGAAGDGRPGSEGALWAQPTSALGPYARYVAPKTLTRELTTPAPHDWAEILELAGDLGEIWVAPLEGLRDAGVPAPHPDTVLRELTQGGAVTAHEAACMWERGETTIALVDAAVPDLAFDQTLVRIDPFEPGTVAAAAEQILGRS